MNKSISPRVEHTSLHTSSCIASEFHRGALALRKEHSVQLLHIPTLIYCLADTKSESLVQKKELMKM